MLFKNLSFRDKLLVTTSRRTLNQVLDLRRREYVDEVRANTAILRPAQDDEKWANENEQSVKDAVEKLREMGLLRPANALDSILEA